MVFLSKEDAIRTLKKYNDTNPKKEEKLFYLIRIDEDKTNEFSLMYIYEEIKDPIEELVTFPEKEDIDELVTKCANKVRALQKKHKGKKSDFSTRTWSYDFSRKIWIWSLFYIWLQ